MSRLKALAPTLTRLTPRIAPLSREQQEQVRLAERDRNVEWRRWYKTARWQKLRFEVLTRDLWICKKTGVLLVGKYPADDSAVVDHITPHRGDPVLFWDPANLQSLSKAYHDSVKQRQERGGRGG